MLRRLLAVLATTGVFAVVIAVVSCSGPTGVSPVGVPEEKDKGDKDKGEKGSDAHAWPTFGGGLQRNMVNTVEKGMPVTWDVESGKNIKWQTKLGSKAYGGPIVSGGKVFIGTNNDAPRDPSIKGDKGILMCFDEASGKFLWQAVHDKLKAGQVNDWPHEGICSSPFVEGNRMWYVSNRCEVVCRDTDGKEVWSLDMIGKLDVFPHNLAVCSPLVVGDTLYVITSNGVDEEHINIPKPAAPSFIALEKKNGKVLWTNNLPSANVKPGAELKSLVDRGLVLMHGQWSNPVYAEVDGKGEIIFPGGDGWLRAFDPKKGDVVWEFDANPKDAVYALGGKGVRSDFLATPVVHDNKLYIGVGQDPEHDFGVGHYWCIDIAKATKTGGDVSDELPEAGPGGKQIGKPNPKSAKVWHIGGMINPPPKKGRKWVFGRTISTAAVADGLCYVAEQEGILHCLDANTGQEHWQHDLGKQTWSSPYVVDGKVYMGSDNETLCIFEHSKTKKKLDEIEMGSVVRATPVAVNGVLFVMTEKQLFAIKQ
jgi:outer membrane protein assembly factor BamB